MRRTVLAFIAAGFGGLITLQGGLAQAPAYTVTGGGTFVGTQGGIPVPRFFGVAATDSGTSDFGEVQMSGMTSSGQRFGFHVDCTCVNVVGSVAYMSGTVRTGTGFNAEDATGKVLRARFDDGSPDRAKGSLLAVGTAIPPDCFQSDPAVAFPGPPVTGQIQIRAVH